METVGEKHDIDDGATKSHLNDLLVILGVVATGIHGAEQNALKARHVRAHRR